MIDIDSIQSAIDIASGKVKGYSDAATNSEELIAAMQATKDTIEAQQALNDYLALQNLNVVP
jgi:hypothetical protein